MKFERAVTSLLWAPCLNDALDNSLLSNENQGMKNQAVYTDKNENMDI